MDHRVTTPYAYGPKHMTTSHQTSSAFSASAQPDEDWTKISDLAERRRIQNRIAQRNYRKKLKRRLEDLERKAASTSPSPEQQPIELPSKIDKPKYKSSAPSQRKRNSSPKQVHQQATPPSTQHTPHPEDWMFSNQHTRQVTTSPPPFVYPNIDPSHTPPSPQLPGGTFPAMSELYYQFPQQMDDGSAHFRWQDKSFAVKQESGVDSDVAPLYLNNYAPYTTAEIPFTPAFQEPCLTPELCDMYEYSSAGSPAEFNTFPQTPLMMPLTPPYVSFEQ